MVLISKPASFNCLKRFRCFLHTHLAHLCYLLILHTFIDLVFSLLVADGWFLLTVETFSFQSGHNDLDHTKEARTDFFITATHYKVAPLWVGDGSQNRMKYPEKRNLKCQVAKGTKMKLITNPENYVFMRHGYLQHAISGCSRTLSIVYHIYLIPDVHPLKDALSSAYGLCFKIEGETSFPST